MWSRIPICFWPLAWSSLWLLGVATATASKLSEAAQLSSTQRLRSPLLTLHVSTLKPNQHAGQTKPYEMQGGPLHLVKPNCGVS